MSAEARAGISTLIFASLLLLISVPLALGGIWLMALGGSWYYALAGIAIGAAGWLLLRNRILGIWIYLAVFLVTLIWSFWEAGLDGWALLPRLTGPTILALWALFLLPGMRDAGDARDSNMSRRIYWGASLASIAVLAGVLIAASAADPLKRGETWSSGETAALTAATTVSGADWRSYGGTKHATRYSTLSQITPDNVSQLKKVWTFRTGDLPPNAVELSYAAETTPIKVKNSIYLCTPSDQVIALDAASGREIWRYDPHVPEDATPYSATCRGVAYYASPGADPRSPCAERIFLGTLNARLVALDADTGLPCADFGVSGQVNLETGLGHVIPGYVSVTSPPMVVNGVVVVNHQVLDGQRNDAPSGVLRGYDALTGEIAWAWDMGNPAITRLPPPGKTYTRGTPNSWAPVSADEALGLVYFPMGNSANDYFGGDRAPYEEEYSSSIIAIDAATGQERWHFQTVHHDLWDYDIGSTPSLISYETPSGPRPAMIVTSKQGEIFILDRETGKPLSPVEEHPVPQGAARGDHTASTQPESVAFPNLVVHPPREEDSWGVTPIDQMWCRIQFRQAEWRGRFTPPSLKPFLVYPSYNGGVDWGGVAVDEGRNILIINYNDIPMYDQLLTRDQAQDRGMLPRGEPGAGAAGSSGPVPQEGVPYAAEIKAWRNPLTGVPCREPPFGSLRAVDLKTHKILWERPLGSAESNGPFGLPSFLPFDIGTPNNGGAVVTKGGVTFIAAATDPYIRAFDTVTGKQLWKARLPAGGQATPMTFEADGHQFVALMAGGHHFMQTEVGDYLLAWSLPIHPGQ